MSQVVKTFRRIFCFSVVWFGALTAAFAQTTMIWTGSGSGSNWGTTGNWNSGTPGSADIAEFSSNTVKTPNISANTSVGEIVFKSSTDAESFTGTRTLTLNSVSGLGIDNQTSLTHTFANKFALGASQTWQSTASGGGLTFNGTIDLAGFNLTLGLASSGASTITLAGNVSGTGSGLTLTGHGTAVLTATGSYTGDTTIGGGTTLQYSGSGGLSNTSTVVVNSGGTFDLNGVSDTIASVTGSGNITLGSAILTMRGSADTTFSGVISGSGGLTKSTGTGTVTLSGANTYDGTTNINAGIIRIQNATALGSSTGGTVVTSGEVLELGGTGGSFTVTGEALSLTGTGVASGGVLRNIDGTNLWTGNLTLTGNSRVNSDAGTLTISGDIGGTQNLTIGGVGGTTISGIIGTGSGTLTKDGGGTLTLSGANTYSGKTTISGGALSVSSLNSVTGGSASSSLGAPTTAGNGTIVLGATTTAATLIYTGAGETTDRVINLAGTTGGGTIDARGTGALTFTSNFTSGAGSKTLTLTGTSATGLINTISGVIPNNSGTNLTSVEKSGPNTWALTGTNTYTGTTVINGGILSISTIANAGTSSSIGAANNGAGDLVIDGGSLKYTGALASSNRQFTLGPGGGTLDASGSGALTFSNPGSIAYTSTSAHTLTLAGTGTGSLAAAINNNTGVTSLVKNGSGTWTVSGNSGFTGAINVNSGTLIAAGNNNALGTGTAGTTVAGTGAALGLSGGFTFSNAGNTLNISGTGVSNGGALFNSAGNNIYAGAITLATSGSSIAANLGTTLTVSGAVGSSNLGLTIGASGGGNSTKGNVTLSGNLNLGTGSLIKENAGTLTINGPGNTVGAVNLNSGGGTIAVGATSTLTTAAFAAATGTTLSIATGGSIIANYASGSTTFAGDLSGGGIFQKNGAGILVFDHSMTASSLTLVLNGGTLLLANNGTSVVFDTIHITANTILDFGSGIATFLTSANLVIDNGVTVNVVNWANLTNAWYVKTTGGAAGTFMSAVQDQIGQAPENQITINGFSSATTSWVTSQGGQYYAHEIRPVPEPATYGALLLAASLAVVAWRRRGSHA